MVKEQVAMGWCGRADVTIFQPRIHSKELGLGRRPVGGENRSIWFQMSDLDHRLARGTAVVRRQPDF
jgi:hypothetical protein